MINIETRVVGYDNLGQLAGNNESIRHTPHLGGELSGYHWVLLDEIVSQVVLVDTASATDDKLGGVGRVDGQGFVNGSWVQSPAAALNRLELNSKKATQLRGVLDGLEIEEEGFLENAGKVSFANLVQLHEHIVNVAALGRTSVLTARKYWREQGDSAEAMASFMTEEGMFRRWYDLKGKQFKKVGTDQTGERKNRTMYFEGEDTSGLLPTVEALLAIWAVQGALEGRDIVFEFLNPESVRYITEKSDFEKRVKRIADGTLTLLGVNAEITYCYLVANDYSEMDELGGSSNQFDRLKL